jgi:hypothetical protein
MKPLLFVLSLMLGSSAVAAPPPPPPNYIFEAGNILAARPAADAANYAALFADDVRVYRNGQLAAEGKAAWLKLHADEAARYNGRIIAFSEGRANLLVIDTYDTVDRRNLPPTFLADPRPAARSTLYQFGADQRIHTVRISEVEGILVAGKD